jgi:hypothetical protein
MRRAIGIKAFKEIPSIKADIYLGGRIPAKPTMLPLRMAMQTPKLIMTPTERLKAISGGRSSTIRGRRRKSRAQRLKQTKILVFKAIEFWYVIVIS